MNQTTYKLRCYLIIALSLFLFSKKGMAQNCQLSSSLEILGGNNIKASIPANGNLFWTVTHDNTFQLSTSGNTQNPSTIFANGIWLGAKDDLDQLKMSAATYTNITRYDFVSGPIFNDSGVLSFDCDNYDRLWQVFGFEIKTHLDDFSDNGTVDNPIENIYAYPGHQNPHFENIHGFALPNTPQGLAPFFDENSDGIYNPDDGDFPLPENVSADRIPSQIIWGVYNDAGANNTQTGGNPLTVEIQQTAWSFYCDDNDLLNNTVFTSHKIINRGNGTLNSMIIGNWMDFDLGCYTDDYLGCIPDLNTYYTYNEDPIDGSYGADCIQGIPTYDDNPPVQAVTFLNKNMSAFGAANNGGVGGIPSTVDPTQPIEYYNYMQGLWRDGSPYTTGGSGYLSGIDTTTFLFPDNPNDPNGWSMVTANLPFGDRRCIASSTIDNDFPPGGVVNIDMAYTLYQDENLDHIETVNLVYDNTPLLQQMYNDGFGTGCSEVICLDDCVWTGDADKDSVVTVCDVLQIGLAFGEQGNVRERPLIWQPFEGDDWGMAVNGTNLKHTDCNGDAVIDIIDFFYVDQHFDFSYKTDPIVDEYPVGPELVVLSHPSSNIGVDTLLPNESGIARVFLMEHEDIYGLAMTVEVDPEFLKIQNVLSNKSPWEANMSGAYGLGKNQIEEGEYHYVYTKTDGENTMSETEQILQIMVAAQTTDYMLVETQIRLKNIKAILNDGTELNYGAQNLIVNMFNANGDGVILNNENLETTNINIFPNPTADILNITLDKLPTHLSIFDIYGKRVLEKTSGFENEMQLPIDHFSAGVYFVKIRIGEKDFVKKVIKL